MGKDDKTEKDEIVFEAYEPLLKPLGMNQGGGFRLQVDISESDYKNIIRLLDPKLKNTTLLVKITPIRKL